MQKYSIWFKYTFKEMLIIGIAGGTGSGKTTVVRKIIESLPAGEVVLLPQDSYYKDSSHVPVEERQNINFDHPDAFEWSLLSKHVMMLKEGNSIEQPTYSYLTWGSSDETIATVAEDGTVTAVTPGNVVIYAYTHDGSGYRGEFPLVINEIVNAEDISIEDLPALHMYQTAKLSCTFVPEIAVANSVDWESSDENVVTVKNGKVTAVGFGEATVTGTCRATGNKAATTVKVTTGWWVWDAACGFDGWGMGTKGASFEVTEDRMVVTTATQSSGALRADLTLDTKNMKVIMDLVNYPVIALHANLPDISKQGYTLDLVASNGTKGESKLSKGKALSDGTKLLVYNVKSLNKFTEEEVTFTTFQIKIADMMSAELPTGRYEMYWIRTFASEEEAVQFAEDQIAANK